MSNASPSPSQWVEPPTFRIAHTGYLSGDVERLLDALEDAADRGEPLGPLIEARSLTTVSFGDDMDEVNAFLAQLRGDDGPVPSSTAAAVTTPASGPSVPIEDPRSAASQRILAHIDEARFRMTRRSVVGYEVSIVDEFLDDVVTQVRAGGSILPTLRHVRFPMARRGNGGYGVGDVDGFLDRIEALAGDDASKVRRSAIQIPDDGSPRKGVVTPVLWALGIAVVLYVALFIL